MSRQNIRAIVIADDDLLLGKMGNESPALWDARCPSPRAELTPLRLLKVSDSRLLAYDTTGLAVVPNLEVELPVIGGFAPRVSARPDARVHGTDQDAPRTPASPSEAAARRYRIIEKNATE